MAARGALVVLDEQLRPRICGGDCGVWPGGESDPSWGESLCDPVQEEAFAGERIPLTAPRKRFRIGKVGGEGSPPRSLAWGCGWVNKPPGVWNLSLEALSPEPGDQGMPRQCAGLPREGTRGCGWWPGAVLWIPREIAGQGMGSAVSGGRRGSNLSHGTEMFSR